MPIILLESGLQDFYVRQFNNKTSKPYYGNTRYEREYSGSQLIKT